MTGRILTIERLKNTNVCRDTIALFAKNFGESVLITEAWAIENAAMFDWICAAENLLSVDAWGEYARRSAPYWAAYAIQCDPHWAECEKQCAIIRAEYEERTVYHRAECQKQCAPHWAKYHKQCAALFAKLYILEGPK